MPNLHRLPPSALLLGLVTTLTLGMGLRIGHTTVLAQQVQPVAPTTPAATTVPLVGTTDQVLPSAITLTAIPPRYGDETNELVAEPGEVLQATLRVRNASDQPLSVQSLARDFIIGEDGETPIEVIDTVSNRWSLANWISITPANQVLQPNQTGVVNVVINVPPDALPGGHYAMVLHEPSTDLTLGDSVQTGAGSGISQRVGTLLYMTVAGEINEEAFIRSFEFPKLTEYGPVPFSFSLENRSDIHIRPDMKIDIKNIFGQEVATLPVETRNIFPYTSRDFDGQWDRVWGIGPYQAQLSVMYGTEGRMVTTTTTFWLIPYTLVAAAIVAFLILLVLLWGLRRHTTRRHHVEKTRISELEQEVERLKQSKSADKDATNEPLG